MTWLKSLRLHWDAINYQWQRGIVGFNIDRQRDVLREFGLDSARPWQLVAVITGMAFAWVIAVLALSRVRRTRADAEVALWARACRRLARAGLARRPDEGPSGLRRARGARWPRWGDLFLLIGDQLRAARYGAPDARRATLLSNLRASVDALPPCAACARELSGRIRAQSNASRERPMRRRRARSFSSASAWIWRTRSRVTPSSRESCSSVATSRPFRP